MKVIISGSRTVDDYDLVTKIILESKYTISEVVNSMTRGVATCGLFYAVEKRLPLINFPPDFYNNGRMAGKIRDNEMVAYADAAIIVVEMKKAGEYSPGSMNLLAQMYSAKKRYYAVTLNNGKISNILMDLLTEKEHYDSPINTASRLLVESKDGEFRFYGPKYGPNRNS
jgi:hypothetical protein